MDESNVAKIFNAILQDIKNNRKITECLGVKSHSKNIIIYMTIIKFMNAKTIVLEGDYGFYETFNNFDLIDNMCSKR